MELCDLLKTAVWDGMDSRCSEPCWADTNSDTIRGCGCMDKAADAILAALDAAGLVVVPWEPTIPMQRVIVKHMTPDAAKYWPMVLVASPYAKKGVG